MAEVAPGGGGGFIAAPVALKSAGGGAADLQGDEKAGAMVDLTALRSARPDLLDQAAGAWSRLGDDFGKQAAALRGDVVARQQSAGRAGVPPVRATTSAHAVAATIMGRTRPRRVRWAHGHPSVDGANGPAAR